MLTRVVGRLHGDREPVPKGSSALLRDGHLLFRGAFTSEAAEGTPVQVEPSSRASWTRAPRTQAITPGPLER